MGASLRSVVGALLVVASGFAGGGYQGLPCVVKDRPTPRALPIAQQGNGVLWHKLAAARPGGHAKHRKNKLHCKKAARRARRRRA